MISSKSSERQLPRYYESNSTENNEIKFSQLKNSLINCDTDFIINLLIQQLQKTDKLQVEIKQMERQLKLEQDQKQHIKTTLHEKKLAFKQLCETQQKNVQNIQHLQKQLSHLRHKFKLSKDPTVCHQSSIEKKYKQLSKCMNEYVANTADIQQQFKRNFFILKNQNIRLHAENENLVIDLKQQSITAVALSRELKNIRILQQTTTKFKQDNQRLIKQIQHGKLIHKDLCFGVASMQTERIQLERQLQKVKQICQNSNSTNRQISEKYQELLKKYRQQQRERLIIADNCKGSSQKIKQLQTCIIKQQQEYTHRQSQFQKLKKVNKQLEQNNIELISQLANLQKSLIQVQTILHSNCQQVELLNKKLSSSERKAKQLQKIISEVQSQHLKQREKSQCISKQIQKFMNKPNGILKSILKPTKDLTYIKSSKTMATSSSQSRVQKINDENIRPF